MRKGSFVMGFAEECKETLLQDLRQLISMDTSNPPGNESEAAAFVQARMASMGGICATQEIAPGRANAVCRFPFSAPEKGPCLIFNSHLDVVPPGEAPWTYPPFRAHAADGRVYGRGASDAKGSVAAMMSGIRRALDQPGNLRGELIFTAVAAEETGGLGTQYWVRNRPEDPRVCVAVVGEPTHLIPYIAHKGVSRRKVSVRGRSVHSSDPAQGINAIYPLARLALFIEELNRRLADKKDPVLGSPVASANVIRGGVKDNVIPDYCELHMDRRRVMGEDRSQFDREIQEWAREMAAKDPSFECRVEVLGDDKEPVAISPEEPIVRAAVESVHDVTGRRETPRAMMGATDMTFLVHQGKIPTVILGPGLGSHVVDESVETQQLEEAALIYARIISRVLGTGI